MCKYEERCHPHPTPTHPTQQKTSYAVASTMCASARNILCLKHRKCVQVRGTLPSPPHPNPSHPTKNIIWRSIDHACKFKKHPVLCKCKERYHPHLTPPQPMKLGQTPPRLSNMLVSIVAFLAISTVDAVASGAVVAVRSHCCHVATRTWNESIEHHLYANFSGSWIPKNTCGTKASMAP